MKMLTSLGISVDQVRSTDEALNNLHAKKYDAVISDINREGDGFKR